MIRLLIAAPASGSGKTSVTCALRLQVRAGLHRPHVPPQCPGRGEP